MEEVTNRQIIAYARSRRTTVSAAQLSRWRELGLMGPYQRRGRGRAKGQTVYYWPGAPRLALFIARELKQKKMRNFDVVGWKAWMEGYPITGFARAVLCREIDYWRTELEGEVRAGSSPPTPRRRHHPSVEAHLQSVRLQMPLICALALGTTPQYADLVNYLKAQGKVTPRNWQPALRAWEGPGEFLRLDHVRRAVEAATDRDLECFRDDVLMCWCAAVEYTLDHTLRIILPPHDPPMVLMWIAFSRMGRNKHFDLAHEARAGFAKLTRMRDNPPQVQAAVVRLRHWRMENRRARRRIGIL